MTVYGLIGFPLSHSFSEGYFTKKFQKEQIANHIYRSFPLETIDAFPALLQSIPDLNGLNVTLPYKEQVMAYLDELDEEAAHIGAVNTIKFKNGKLKGYNTDVYGFEQSLQTFIGAQDPPKRALVLGTGGASKAVLYVLEKMEIEAKKVSRSKTKGDLTYEELNPFILQNHRLIINTTPLGTSPNIETAPDLAYNALTDAHFLFDLVYNPEKTLFLTKGERAGAAICNGLEMLHGQAEKAWQIWND